MRKANSDSNFCISIALLYYYVVRLGKNVGLVIAQPEFLKEIYGDVRK